MVVVILKSGQAANGRVIVSETGNGRIADIKEFTIENLKQKAKELFFSEPVWNVVLNGPVADVKLFAQLGTQWLGIDKNEELLLLKSETPIVFYCHPILVDVIDSFITWTKQYVEPKVVMIIALCLLLMLTIPSAFMYFNAISFCFGVYFWSQGQKLMEKKNVPENEKSLKDGLYVGGNATVEVK